MKPILKWVGGKRQLIREIKELMPKKYNKYFEPFVGGGALLFEIKPDDAVINDLNYELFNLYNIVKDFEKMNKMIETLDRHEASHSENYFYSIRELDRNINFKELDDYEIAARTVYLNKSGYNGLYRVNSKGEFNVPFGKKEKVNTYEKNNLFEINEFLNKSKIKILNKDFEDAVREAEFGDFVYFDPPYDKVKNDTFTAYQKNFFDKSEQIRLFNVFEKLSKKGVNVMLSNHNTDFITELYSSYNINIVHAKRMINSDSTKRGKVEEVIITNYEVNNCE